MKPIPRKHSLSPRERQCLEHAAAGCTTGEIAKVLGLSPRTVDHHIASAMRKLDAPTRTAAAARLIALKVQTEVVRERKQRYREKEY